MRDSSSTLSPYTHFWIILLSEIIDARWLSLEAELYHIIHQNAA